MRDVPGVLLRRHGKRPTTARARAHNPQRHCGAQLASLWPCHVRTAAQVPLSQNITHRRKHGVSSCTIDLLARTDFQHTRADQTRHIYTSNHQKSNKSAHRTSTMSTHSAPHTQLQNNNALWQRAPASIINLPYLYARVWAAMALGRATGWRRGCGRSQKHSATRESLKATRTASEF